MICAHMVQYISFVLHTKRKKNPSKTCCFTTGFELEKNEEKKRGTEKNPVPPYVFEKYVLLKKFKFTQCQENV